VVTAAQVIVIAISSTAQKQHNLPAYIMQVAQPKPAGATWLLRGSMMWQQHMVQRALKQYLGTICMLPCMMIPAGGVG
jgi:hypothetical protein